MGIWEIEIETVPVDGICGGARSLQRVFGSCIRVVWGTLQMDCKRSRKVSPELHQWSGVWLFVCAWMLSGTRGCTRAGHVAHRWSSSENLARQVGSVLIWKPTTEISRWWSNCNRQVFIYTLQEHEQDEDKMLISWFSVLAEGILMMKTRDSWRHIDEYGAPQAHVTHANLLTVSA